MIGTLLGIWKNRNQQTLASPPVICVLREDSRLWIRKRKCGSVLMKEHKNYCLWKESWLYFMGRVLEKRELIWVLIKLSEAENRAFIRKEKVRTSQTSHKVTVPSYRDGGVIGASFVLRHLNKHTLEIQARCTKSHLKAHIKRIWQNPSNLLVCQNKAQLLNGGKCKVPFKAVKLGQWCGSLGKGINCYSQWPEFHPQIPRGGKIFNSFRFFADLHMLTMARVHTSPVDTHQITK